MDKDLASKFMEDKRFAVAENRERGSVSALNWQRVVSCWGEWGSCGSLACVQRWLGASALWATACGRLIPARVYGTILDPPLGASSFRAKQHDLGRGMGWGYMRSRGSPTGLASC